MIRVHPRIRGEYQKYTYTTLDEMGSPPHTRGIQEDFVIVRSHLRFTPAYAGNTG